MYICIYICVCVCVCVLNIHKYKKHIYVKLIAGIYQAFHSER